MHFNVGCAVGHGMSVRDRQAQRVAAIHTGRERRQRHSQNQIHHGGMSAQPRQKYLR